MPPPHHGQSGGIRRSSRDRQPPRRLINSPSPDQSRRRGPGARTRRFPIGGRSGGQAGRGPRRGPGRPPRDGTRSPSREGTRDPPRIGVGSSRRDEPRQPPPPHVDNPPSAGSSNENSDPYRSPVESDHPSDFEPEEPSSSESDDSSDSEPSSEGSNAPDVGPLNAMPPDDVFLDVVPVNAVPPDAHPAVGLPPDFDHPGGILLDPVPPHVVPPLGAIPPPGPLPPGAHPPGANPGEPNHPNFNGPDILPPDVFPPDFEPGFPAPGLPPAGFPPPGGNPVAIDPNPNRCDNRRLPASLEPPWQMWAEGGVPNHHPPLDLTRCAVPAALKHPVERCQGHLFGLVSAALHGEDFRVCRPCAQVAKNESKIEMMWISLCRPCSQNWILNLHPNDTWRGFNDCNCESEINHPNVVLCTDCQVERCFMWWAIAEQRARDHLPLMLFNHGQGNTLARIRKTFSWWDREVCRSGCICGRDLDAKIQTYWNDPVQIYDARSQLKICAHCWRKVWNNRAWFNPT